MQRPTLSPSASAPSATTVGEAGSVGVNATVEIHGTVGEQCAVGLKGGVLGKEAPERKEHWAGNRQQEKSGSRGKDGGKGHMGRERRSTSLDGCTSSETWCPQTKPERPRTNPNDTESFSFRSSVRPANERRKFRVLVRENHNPPTAFCQRGACPHLCESLQHSQPGSKPISMTVSDRDSDKRGPSESL